MASDKSYRARRTTRRMVLAIACAIAAGCGDGSGNGSGTGGVTTEQGTLAAETIWLQQDATNQVVEQTEDSITVAGIRNDIEPGEIILSTEGRGALRKVLSTETVGGNTLVQTSQADIAEAFEELDVQVKPGFNEDLLGEIDSGVPGLDIDWVPDPAAASSNASQLHSRAVSYNTLSVSFHDLVLSTSKGIGLDGSVAMQADPEFGIVINRAPGATLPSIASLTAGYTLKLQGSLTISSTYGGELGVNKTWVDKYVGKPVVVGWLIFSPRLKVESSSSGTAAGGLSHTQTLSVTAKAKESYARGSGWTPTSEFTPSLTASEAAVDAEFGLTLVPVEVTLSYELYGVAGPFGTIGVEVDATGTHAVQNFIEGIDAVVEGGVGGGVGFIAETPAGLSEIFGASWTPFDVTFDLIKKELFRQFFPFQTTSSIQVGDNGPAPDDVFEVEVDGVVLGQTDKGGTGAFRVGALAPGDHTLTITCLDDGLNGADVCTLGVSLANGFLFTDGSDDLSAELELYETVDFAFIVPQHATPSQHRALPRSEAVTEHFEPSAE